MGVCCDSGENLRPAAVEPSSSLSKPAAAPKEIKVEYFEGAYGRPGALYFLLEHAKADYEYVQVAQADWPSRKANDTGGEFGFLPIVQIKNGPQQQQTVACLRSLGIKYGYYDPKDWAKCGVIDMICETNNELFNAAATIMFFTQPDDQPAEIEKLKEGLLAKFLGIVDAQLKSNGFEGWIMGASLTIADFALAQTLFNIIFNEMCPLSAPLQESVKSLPTVHNYMKSLKKVNCLYLLQREKRPF